MGSSDFGLYINHSGSFVIIDNVECYTGPHFDRVLGLDRDKFGYFDLEDVIKNLGYVSWSKIWYKIPGTNSYRVIKDDSQVMDMLAFLVDCSVLNVYVEGSNKLEDIGDRECRAEEVVGVGVNDRETNSLGMGAGEGGHEYDRDSKESSEDDQEYYPSDSNISDVSLADLDYVQDEGFIGDRRNLTDMNNIFDIIDSNDGFDVDLGTTPDSDYSQSDGGLIESDSDDSCFTFSKRRVVYDPKCNHQNLELVLGMHFQDGYECRKALTTWAIENGRFIHIRDVTKSRCIARCQKDCPWYVYASIVPLDGSFVIKTYRGDHTCPRSMNNKLLNSKWIANKYLNVFRVRYNMSVKDLRDDILHRFKSEVPKDRLYKAKKIAQDLVRGSVEAHYASIRGYTAELRRVDREGRYELLLGEGFVFKGLYIGVSAIRKAFKASCRYVIGLDGCHLKTYLGGILLCATAKDRNNGMFPIAWAVVEIENEMNWTWFLKCLFHDLEIEDGNGWTLISDQQKGLENAVRSLAPHAEHRNCARHVYMNWKKQQKGATLKNLFWRAVTCTYVEDFKVAIADLKTESPAAFEDFMARDTNKFCKAFISTSTCYDAIDNNISESFNSYIVHARGKHVIHMCEEIRQALMVRQVQKVKEMSKVTDKITPSARKLLEERRINSADCILYPALNHKFEVCFEGDKFVVNVDRSDCTCRVWQLTGIPCIHGISAIQYLGLDPTDHVSDFFNVTRYMSAYEFGIQPIRGEKMWPDVDDPIVKPPLIRSMPGRPKKRRIRAPEERDCGTKLSRHGSKMSCSQCGARGHNKRGCKNAPIQRPQVEKRRRGRPSKEVTAAQPNASVTQNPSSSRSSRPNTYKERAMARKGVGVYTSELSGNVYYHSSMTNQRVVHVNRRYRMRSSTTRQSSALPVVPTTQESRNMDE